MHRVGEASVNHSLCFKIGFFDLDLTLVDSLNAFYRAYKKALNDLVGRDVSYEEFLQAYCKDSLNDLLPRDIDKTAFWRYFRRNYHGFDARPMNGAHDVLKWMRSHNIITIIVTGREISKNIVAEELRRLGLLVYVDEVYTLEDENREESLFDKSALIKDVLAKYRISPEKAFLVGDYWMDMVSGQKAGVLTIGYLNKCRDPSKLYAKGAIYVVEDLRDIPPILLSHCKKTSVKTSNI